MRFQSYSDDLSLPPSLNQDYMYIFDKNNHQIYKGNHVSLVVVVLGGNGYKSLSFTFSGKTITVLHTTVITISLVNVIIITQYFTYSKSLIN